jgi:membrane-associated protease RseP (regulator of RpoE activity)
MPSSPPDSNDSPPPSAMPSPEHAAPGHTSEAAAAPLAWRTNALLFAGTVVSCFSTWFVSDGTPQRALHAAQFTASLLGILLAHEFGHYIAARIHKVDASLPYFLPLPLLSPFGTMGAVIRMRSIPTRRALLDIGAAGPLAGLTLAIPIYAWGVAHSEVVSLDSLAGGSVELGNSLLLRLLDHLFAAPVPDGMDIVLSPVAFAGWGGMFVTMINLIPVGQLDGGHVAYALFGPRQNRLAQWVHRSMLAFFFVSVGSFVLRDVRAGFGLWRIGRHIDNSLFWLLWFEVLAVLGTFASRPGDDRVGFRPRLVGVLGLAVMAGAFHERTSPALWLGWFLALGVLLAMEIRGGTLRRDSTLLDHPPTGSERLGPGRAAIAIVTLLLFAALFMPSPFSM